MAFQTSRVFSFFAFLPNTWYPIRVFFKYFHMKKTISPIVAGYSAIALILLTPFIAFAWPDGLFWDYFQRMTGACTGTDEVIYWFQTDAGNYGTKQCKSVSDIITSFFANQHAPVWQAVLGFDVTGKPVFGTVNWTRSAADIWYAWGRVGIGTLIPSAQLDVTADILVNWLTIWRGGWGISSNAALGWYTLSQNSAAQNTALGSNALRNNTTGNSNTAIGTNSMQNNTTASQNIAVWVNALLNNSSWQNNTVIGINSMTSNVSGTQNVAVGENALQPNISGIQNVSIWVSSLLSNTIGSQNIAIGTIAWSNLTTGSNNIIIGHGAQATATNASNQIRLGNTSVTYAWIQVAWTVTSDRNLKSDITGSTLWLDFIKSLNPVIYTRKGDVSRSLEFGFIAQEVEQLLQKNNIKNPGMVSTDDTGIKSIRYNDFFAPIVRSIQELTQSHDALRATVEEQNAQIQELKARLEALESNKK